MVPDCNGQDVYWIGRLRLDLYIQIHMYCFQSSNQSLGEWGVLNAKPGPRNFTSILPTVAKAYGALYKYYLLVQVFERCFW